MEGSASGIFLHFFKEVYTQTSQHIKLAKPANQSLILKRILEADPTKERAQFSSRHISIRNPRGAIVNKQTNTTPL